MSRYTQGDVPGSTPDPERPPEVILETERLRLREFEASDTGDVRQMLVDDEAQRIFARVVQLPDYAERWVARNQERYRQDGHGLWALETKAEGTFAGDCGITCQQVGDDRLFEVGYHLTLAARGQGYATEAASACLRYAFERLGAPRVVSIVAVSNPASGRVAERIHARREEGLERYGEPIYLYSTERADLKS